MSEKRYPECLLNLPPAMRFCKECDKLLECEHGQQLQFGDMSIRDKVLKLDYIITDTAELEKMTLEELIDYNNARKEHEKRQKMRAKNMLSSNEGLTAGAYDRELKKWVTDVLSGTDAVNVEGYSPETEGLTAGYWDPEKKRWVAKK